MRSSLVTYAFFFVAPNSPAPLATCVTQCPGGLDIFLIMDKSGSIVNFAPNYLFVKALTDQFLSERTRFSIVLFDSYAQSKSHMFAEDFFRQIVFNLPYHFSSNPLASFSLRIRSPLHN
jgi:hypothetical protein